LPLGKARPWTTLPMLTKGTNGPMTSFSSLRAYASIAKRPVWSALGVKTDIAEGRAAVVYGALSSHRQTDPAKFTMPLFAPRLIYSTATVSGWWLPRWVPSQPLAEVREATSDLLTMLSNGALTPPAIARYSFMDFQEAVRLADGEAGQERSCWISPISPKYALPEASRARFLWLASPSS
jgi:hypothetical protein